jgi:hypothetical protein
MMPTDSLPRVGYDHVEFEFEGHRIVAAVVAYDDDGCLLLSNDNWDDIWHVPVEEVRVVKEPLNHPPADW